jgi:transcriptional regulator with XRE-family HTH domain
VLLIQGIIAGCCAGEQSCSAHKRSITRAVQTTQLIQREAKPMARTARAARARIPKQGLGLGRAIRRIRELHGIGQEVLAERSGLSQGYLSQIESGSWTTLTEDALGRIAAGLGVEPWVILAQAAGLRIDEVERFTEDERIWLDAYRALDPPQREVILRVAMVMTKPPLRKRSG